MCRRISRICGASADKAGDKVWTSGNRLLKFGLKRYAPFQLSADGESTMLPGTRLAELERRARRSTRWSCQ